MKSFLAFCLVFLSLISYVFLALKFGVYQRFPLFHFLFAMAGLAILMHQIRARFTWWRFAGNVSGWLLVLFFAWWTLSYSVYKEPHGVQVGRSAELTGSRLADAEGEPLVFSEVVTAQKASLLVFYRGYW